MTYPVTLYTQGTTTASAGVTSRTPSRPSVTGLPNPTALLHLAFVRINVIESPVTATTGWTKIYESNNGTDLTLAVFAALGTVAANPVITWTTATTATAGIVMLSGQLNPFDATLLNNFLNNSNNSGTGSPWSTGNVNASQIGAFIYAVGRITGASVSTPTGFEESLDANALAVGWRSNTGSGDSTGTVTSTLSLGGNWVGQAFEVFFCQGASGVEFSEFEISTLIEPLEGLALRGIEIATLIAPALPPPSSGRRRLIIVN